MDKKGLLCSYVLSTNRRVCVDTGKVGDVDVDCYRVIEKQGS
jgi:hypothetical protein